MPRLPLLVLLYACGGVGASDSATAPPGGAITGAPTGSAPSTGTPAGTATGTPTGSPPTDFRARGPFGSLESDSDVAVETCTMRTTRYLPEGTAPTGLVVLSHGFQRNKSHVAELADHLASWGVAVVTPNLCHASAFDTDHEANAADLVALAEALGQGGPVVYVGHSAGGLATWLASAADPAAVGHVGLDPVDSGQLGAAIAGDHTIPTYALFGEPGLCNSNGNGTSWYAAATDGRAVRLTGADHCDFEGPTDALCTTFCAGGSADDALVHDIVLGATAAFVAWRLGVDPSGADWWTPGGHWYEQMLAAGVAL